MDKCAKYQGMISALLDDELSAAEREALHAHMQDCPDCRRMYDAFAAIAGAEELEEPPEGMLSGAMFKIRNPVPAAKKKPVRWRGWAGAAACLALVIFGVSRLDLNMGAESAAPADCAAPSAYTMSSDNFMSYVADSAKMESAEGAEVSVPADTSLPADTAMPVPMPETAPREEPEEDNAAGASDVLPRLLRVTDENGTTLCVITSPAALQELAPMLADSGTGFAVEAEYADGTTAQFILPVNAEELQTLMKNLG